MAKEKKVETLADSPPALEPHVVAPAHRQRLQKCFEHATKLSTQEKKPDYDYAHTLFAECATQDPANLVYVEALLENLKRKYDGNKKGRMGGFGGARASIKKAAAKEDWKDVLTLGPEALQSNPWDVPTLRCLARACAAHHYNEAELRYLKNALEANPKDVEVNRHCAESLARMGQFDQAIACWSRVGEFGKEADKQQAAEKVSELTVERARGRSGLPGEAHPLPKSPAKAAETSAAPAKSEEPKARPAAPAKTAPAAKKPSAPQPGEMIASHEAAAALATADDPDDEFRRSLEKAIAANPGDVGSLILLADLFAEQGNFDWAAELLNRGMGAAGKSIALLERLEELQVERASHRVAVAEKRVAAQDSAEARSLLAELKAELNRVELAVFRQRADRYPKDTEAKYELGLRLKRAGNQEAALECFAAVGDRGAEAASAALEMGESLQALKRFHEALAEYERAAALASDADSLTGKRALYRGGVLATGMRKLEKAESLFNALLAIDPDYKDLAARLDKIQKIRDSV